MILQFLQLIQHSVYEGNKFRGFWEKGLDENKGERVMLIITELAEAVEAHRKHAIYDYDTRRRMNYNSQLTGWSFDLVDSNDEAWLNWFRAEVKDTLQDEIADAVIRILDYTGGFNIEIKQSEYRKVSTGNFAHDVLRLTHYCMQAYHIDTKQWFTPGKDWNYVIAAIIKFCEWYNIDLAQHIQWKLKYNSTREYKHGKKY